MGRGGDSRGQMMRHMMEHDVMGRESRNGLKR